MSGLFKTAGLYHLRLLLPVCLLLYQSVVYSQESVLFLYDKRSPAQHVYALQAIDKLAQLRPALQAAAIDTATADRTGRLATTQNSRLIVAAGGTAVRLVSQREIPPARLYTLLPRARYQELGLPGQPCQNRQCAVLGIEQPLPRQLGIIRQLFGTDRKIGTITGKYSREMQDEFRRACQRHRLDCLARDIENRDLLPVLNDLLPELDVFVALPDPSVITPKSVRTLLLASYQQRVPVVAFSKSFVRAGAMLAIYTPLEDLSSQTAQLVANYFRDQQQFQRRYYAPEKYSIELNESVARSLKIQIDEQALAGFRSTNE